MLFVGGLSRGSGHAVTLTIGAGWTPAARKLLSMQKGSIRARRGRAMSQAV
jgi:hypothetical protein